MPESTTLKGVEILRVGTWRGLRGTFSYSQDDLDELVAAHEAFVASGTDRIKVSLGGKPREIKAGSTTLGHNDHDEAGNVIREAPVIGKLSRLYRKGDRLLADIGDVPGKLAATVAKAYPDRSIEGVKLGLRKGIEIGGKKFTQAITSLALLGESLPAVEGLADLPKVLGSDEVDDVLVILRGEPDPAELLEQGLAELEAWEQQYLAPLVKNLIGAPVLRSRVRALREGFRQVVGGRIKNARSVTMTREQLIELLGLDESAESPAVVAALAGAEDDTVAEIVALAEGLEFSDPGQFVAWLAGKLDVAPGDLGAIAAAVASALGLEPADTTEEPTDMPEEEPTMQKNQKSKGADAGETVTIGALSQRVEQLETKLAESQATVVKLQGTQVKAAAETRVTELIEAGKAVPSQRETLVSMALENPKFLDAYDKTTPVFVKYGERGSAKGVENGAYEPTDAEVEVMVKAGLPKDRAIEMIRRDKAAQAGEELPPAAVDAAQKAKEKANAD